MPEANAAALVDEAWCAGSEGAMQMKAYGVFVCLCAVLCAASPSTASAQQPAAPDWNEKVTPAVDTKTYSCVDPTDALARRWTQDKPCKLPMYHLPVTGVPSFSEPPRWPTYPPRSPATQGVHTLFWRFPVQPMGPYEVPRHSWR
jgi:hypothetical protein